MDAPLERGFIRLAVVVAACAWVALVSAELGVFRPSWVVLGAVAAIGAGRWASARIRARSDVGDPPPGADQRSDVPIDLQVSVDGAHEDDRIDRSPAGMALTGAVLAGLLAFAAFRFLPPFDTTLWAGDSSVYLSYARQIERKHGLEFEDPLVAQIPVELRRELFLNREVGDVTGGYSRFPGGFLIPDIEQPRVTAGFAPLYPVLVALAEGVFGPRSGLFVAPSFAMLAVAAVFFVGRRLAGLAGAALAGGLLVLSLPQVWFARFGLPAVVAQYFVFAGLFALLVAHERRTPGLAAIGGVLFGLAVFTKFDLLFVLPIVAAGFATWVLLRAARTDDEASGKDALQAYEGRVVASFCAAFGLLLVHNVLHYFVVPSHYELFVEDMLRTVQARWVGAGSGAAGSLWPLLAGALMATGASVLWLRRGAAGRRARIAGACMALLVGVYAAAYLTVSTNRMGETVVWLAWYLSWPVLALALIAPAARVFLRRERPEKAAGEIFLLILLAVAALHYVYDPHEATRQIWSMRRFVPVVIPAVLLVVATLVVVAAERAPGRGSWWLIGGAALTGGVLIAAPSLSLVGERPWRGATEQVREAARSFPPGAVVLVSDDLAGTHLATALTYRHDTDAIIVRSFYSRPAVLEDLSAGLLHRGREVYLALGRDFHFAGPRLVLERRGDLEVRLPVLETTVSRPPNETVVLRAEVLVLRVGERPEEPRAYIDTGNRVDDTLFAMSGFYQRESDPTAFDGSFRWTEATAMIGVPPARELELLLDGGRPEGVDPAVVSIWLGERPVVQSLPLTDAPQAIRVANPSPDDGRVDLRITSSVFVPAGAGLSDDARRLGVRLYGIRLVPPACCND